MSKPQISKTVFKSPYADFVGTNIRHFTSGTSQPILEHQSFRYNGRETVSYTRKVLGNNRAFESFKIRGEQLKVLKNEHGDIVNFKTNMQVPLNNIERVYENVVQAVRENLSILYSTKRF